MAHPPEIPQTIGKGSPGGVFTFDTDPAKYLVGRSRFERPKLISRTLTFEWPGGLEGFSISGQARIAEHRYIGGNASVALVVHHDSRRIELNGQFSGLTAAQNMRELIEVIIAEGPEGGKTLVMPGVFPKEQKVVVEDYRFDHPQEDATASVNYAISFIRTGVGQKVTRPRTTRPPSNPQGSRAKPRGSSQRVFTTNRNYRTLRSLAAYLYHNPNKWREIYNKNTKALQGIAPAHQLPTKLLPLGLKIYY